MLICPHGAFLYMQGKQISPTKYYPQATFDTSIANFLKSWGNGKTNMQAFFFFNINFWKWKALGFKGMEVTYKPHECLMSTSAAQTWMFMGEEPILTKRKIVGIFFALWLAIYYISCNYLLFFSFPLLSVIYVNYEFVKEGDGAV